MSSVQIVNYRNDKINPFALFDSDFENLGEQLSVTLPRICRFWGQTNIFYSVAQHCLSMAEYFKGDEKLQKYALLHEVFEGFSFDCATPIKRMLPAYKKAEERALQSAARIHGLEWPFPDIIKTVDKGLMVMKGESLMNADAGYWRQHGEPVGALYKPDAPMEWIRKDFINLFLELFGEK
ncbi:MAG: hypothetical protein PHE67_00235 [Campylobacterales bacterium]|nr:hypothetical protein [Campylobacterales bacterium]